GRVAGGALLEEVALGDPIHAAYEPVGIGLQEREDIVPAAEDVLSLVVSGMSDAVDEPAAAAKVLALNAQRGVSRAIVELDGGAKGKIGGDAAKGVNRATDAGGIVNRGRLA